MSMKKTRASLKRADSSQHPDDLENVPSCTGIKYIGDPVDGIRFKSGQYRKDRLKNISFDLSQEDPEAIDTVDIDARKNFKGKKMPEVESPIKDRTLGFDLMSLTSRRGHYVDHVKSPSKAEAAGLKHGDLIVAVNGEKVRDLPHDEVVQLIRQSSVDADVITIAVVPKIPENEAEILSEEVVDETTKKE